MSKEMEARDEKRETRSEGPDYEKPVDFLLFLKPLSTAIKRILSCSKSKVEKRKETSPMEKQKLGVLGF